MIEKELHYFKVAILNKYKGMWTEDNYYGRRLVHEGNRIVLYRDWTEEELKTGVFENNDPIIFKLDEYTLISKIEFIKG